MQLMRFCSFDVSVELLNKLNPWSLDGSFMVQKMAITSPNPRLLGVKSHQNL